MPLHVDRRDAVAVLTIDDPDRKNALSPEMVDAIVETVGRLNDDPDVGALVVTGAGSVFCSGADLGNLVKLTAAEGRRPHRGPRDLQRLPGVPRLAAPHDRRGQRTRRRRRHEPRAGVRRARHLPDRALRHPVRPDRPAPRRRSRVDARPARRPADHRGDGAVRRAGRRRARGRPRARRGRASPTRSSSTPRWRWPLAPRASPAT